MPPKLPACGFAFSAKYDGNADSLPIVQMKVKKVNKGKRITVIYGAVGSRSKAVATLKQLLGVGGEVCEDDHTAVELQGDQTKRIPVILKNIGALQYDDSTMTKPQTIKVERINYGYDKFMKKSDTASRPVIVENSQSVSEACILVHGKYWPYCNGQCQYCPPLTDVFEGLEQYCSWFEPTDKKSTISQSLEMTTEEILTGLSTLGMRAEVGEAVRLYEQDKRRMVEKSSQKQGVRNKISSERRTPDTPVVVPRRVVPKVVPRPFNPNQPVRVIMNHLYDEDEEWFVLKISLRDRSLWISDYEEFIHSLVSASEFAIAQIDLIDSRTLKIRFWNKDDRDACKKLLDESMESMLEFETSDAIVSQESFEWHEGEEIEDMDDDGSDGDDSGANRFEFQKIAEELGLESNDEFWEIFCNLIDISDGTTEGMARAFNEAVVRVLNIDDSLS